MDNNIIVLNVDRQDEIEQPKELLFNGLNDKLALAERAIEKIYSEVNKMAPALLQIKEATKKGYRLVVDASDQLLKDIESGKIKLSIEKGGKMVAQIRDANGNYGERLPIKKEVFAKGIDPVQMANAIQMMALKEQLDSIESQIQLIDQGVQDVLQGQQNDRIGLYYSGFALYLESQSVNDKYLKQSLVGQALRSLSESSYQLGLKMQSDIEYLASGEYKNAKGKSVKLIDSRMDSINQSFGYIHQNFMLRAAIYCNEGELSSMSVVLNEYSRFINQTIKNNADLLSQCDKNDDGTDRGIWHSRKKLQLDTSEIYKKIAEQNKVIYLDFVKEA
jgi:hypothetical protein